MSQERICKICGARDGFRILFPDMEKHKEYYNWKGCLKEIAPKVFNDENCKL